MDVIRYAAALIAMMACRVCALEVCTEEFATTDVSSKIPDRGSQYAGGVQHNGKIYFIPRNADNIGVLNIATGVFSKIDISSTISSDWKYIGGVEHNGKIYFIPQNAHNIGVFDIATGVFSTIDISSIISSDSKYSGGVEINGKIYFIPDNADNIGVFDIATGIFSTIDISSIISSDGKYWGGVKINGIIYFAPYRANNIGKFDIATGIFSTIDISGFISSNWKYSGGVEHNGKIYFTPGDADNIGKFDIATGVFSTIDISSIISSNWKYSGGVEHNGIIYFVPHNADNIGELDIATGIFSVIDISSTISSDAKYWGGVAHGDDIFFAPLSSNSIGKLTIACQTTSTNHTTTPNASTPTTTSTPAHVARMQGEDGIIGLQQQEANDVKLLKDVLALHEKMAGDISIAPKKKPFENLSAAAGAKFWNLASFWEVFLQAHVRTRKLKNIVDNGLQRIASMSPGKLKALQEKLTGTLTQSEKGKQITAIDLADLPPELLGELRALRSQGDLSVFDRRQIDHALPLQQLMQAETHAERLRILALALTKEKARLESEASDSSGISLSDALEQHTHQGNDEWDLRSKL